MKNKLQYITIYLLIIITTSLIYSEYTNLIFIINMLLSTFILFKYKITPTKKDFLILWIISIIMLSLYLYTNGSYTLMSMINTITTFYFTIIYYRFNRAGFIDKYINIMIFICIVSLFGFISDMTNTFSFFIDKLPQLINSNPGFGNPHGGFFYVFRNINHSTRNSGFCYEPGKFQFFINLALYFILFCKTNIKYINIKFLILMITLITTMSTTGIIMGVIIIICYIFNKKNNIEKRFIFISVLIGLFIIMIFFYEQAYEVLIKKLQFNRDTKTFDYGSGKTRLNDIKLDLEIFKLNILGNGWKFYEEYWRIKQIGNYLYTTGSSSNSLTSMFAVYGIIFAGYINLKYILNFVFRSKNIIIILLLLFMYFYQNLSQSFSLTPLMIIFMISDNKQLFGNGEE